MSEMGRIWNKARGERRRRRESSSSKSEILCIHSLWISSSRRISSRKGELALFGTLRRLKEDCGSDVESATSLPLVEEDLSLGWMRRYRRRSEGGILSEGDLSVGGSSIRGYSRRMGIRIRRFERGCSNWRKRSGIRRDRIWGKICEHGKLVRSDKKRSSIEVRENREIDKIKSKIRQERRGQRGYEMNWFPGFKEGDVCGGGQWENHLVPYHFWTFDVAGWPLPQFIHFGRESLKEWVNARRIMLLFSTNDATRLVLQALLRWPMQKQA